MRQWDVTVAENGRVCLPVELRRALGVAKGGPLTIELDGDEARLVTVAARVRRAQELTRLAFAGKPMPTIDEFLAWKREQAVLEAAKIDRLAGMAAEGDEGSR